MFLWFIVSALLCWDVAVLASSSASNGTTSHASLSSPAPSCIANCYVSAYSSYWTWAPYEVYSTTSIVAATIIVIVNNRTNTTSTSTVYNSVTGDNSNPFDVPTNSAGTQTAVVQAETAYNQFTNVTLTFPTGMMEDPVDYTWQGTLPTIGPMGQSVCSTGSAVVPYSTGAVTTSAIASRTTTADPGGLLWFLDEGGCQFEFGNASSGNAALNLCSKSITCAKAPQAMVVASYLTETLTSNVDNPPPSTPASAQQVSATSSNNANPGSGIVSAVSAAASKATNTGSNPGSNAGSGQNAASQRQGSGNNGQNTNTNPASPAPSPQGQQQPTSTSPAAAVVGNGSGSNTPAAGGNTANNGEGQTLPAGSAVVIETQPSSPSATPAPVVIGSSTGVISVAPGGSTVLNVGGSTIAFGSTVTFGSGSGATTVAFQVSQGQTQVVVNGQTSVVTPTAGTVTPAPVIIGGSTALLSVAAGGSTVLNVGASIVGLGSTVTFGSGSGATTVVYQTSNGQTQVVVNGQTNVISLSTASGGVGNAIMSGLAGGYGNGTTTAASMFTGSAGRLRIRTTAEVVAGILLSVYCLLF